jgi:hypothetical protein
VHIYFINFIFINIVSEKDGDFWGDKTGINMTTQEIENWTLEGLYDCVLVPALALTIIEENRVQCARAEAEFLRWNEQIELKHAEIYRLRKYNITFNLIWLTLAKRCDSGKFGMVAYARRQADKFQKRVDDLDAEWAGVGVPELRNIPPGKTLVDQVLARRQSEIAKYLPGYKYVQTAAYLQILMIVRFPIPKDNSFTSVEEVRSKYKDKNYAGTKRKTL